MLPTGIVYMIVSIYYTHDVSCIVYTTKNILQKE